MPYAQSTEKTLQQAKACTPTNPFASKHIRPDANEYLFADGSSIDSTVARFNQLGHHAQIIGPHGTGKSTLLYQLVEQFNATGNVILAKLNSSKTRLPFSLPGLLRIPGKTLVVIDGFEQLPTWKRFTIKKIAHARKLGLLVTTHEDQKMATLVRTASSPQTLKAIIRRLDRNQRLGPTDRLTERELCQLLDICDGNVREVLFRLYDRVQAGNVTPLVAE